jgi:hypothetical protein
LIFGRGRKKLNRWAAFLASLRRFAVVQQEYGVKKMKLTASIIAGITVLSLVDVAIAKSDLTSTKAPVLLTDAQMDKVTAGDANAFVFMNTISSFGRSGTFGDASLFVDAVPPSQSASARISSNTALFEGSVSIQQGAEASIDPF